jgi:lipoyl(octanoyl) transferase
VTSRAAPLRPQWLGRLSYAWARRLQLSRRDAVIAGHAPEAFWLLEHDSVITTGLRAVRGLPPPERLRAMGIGLERAERGGLATWHGPGQLVGYLILDLPSRHLKVRTTIAAVEQGVIAWLRGRGLSADRRPGYPGVWLGSDKVCAIGMHFRRGVSMHGFALNLRPDLGAFGLFTPCGISDGGVTSVLRAQGDAPLPEEAALEVGRAVLAAFDTPLELG